MCSLCNHLFCTYLEVLRMPILWKSGENWQTIISEENLVTFVAKSLHWVEVSTLSRSLMTPLVTCGYNYVLKARIKYFRNSQSGRR